MKQILIFIAAALILLSNKAHSINPERLSAKIDSVVSKYVKQGEPGGVIGVVTSKGVLFKKAYGLMNLEYNLQNTDSSRFNLASMSKQFTAFAILQLEKEKKINLDDDVHAYLPDLPAYSSKVTVRHLLHHTSGIASTDNLRLFAGLSIESPWNADGEYNMIKRYDRLNFKPNDEHLYSNAGYFLLAKIVEKVSGLGFAEYMKANVFVPMRMNNALIYNLQGKPVANKADGYGKTGNDFVQKFSGLTSTYGSTNVYASLNDMLEWSRNFLSPKPNDQSIVKRFEYPEDKLNNGDTISYTYGMYTWRYKGLKIVEHSGYTPGYTTQIMIFPENDLAVFVLFNNDAVNRWEIITSIVDWCLADKLVAEVKKERKEIKLNSEILKKYAGKYQMPDGMQLSFSLEKDTFWLMIPDAPKFQLFAESETEMFLKAFDAQCSFVHDKTGDVNEIVWHQGTDNLKCIKIKSAKPLTNSELVAFIGKYYNSALDVEYPVIFKDDQLSIILPKPLSAFLNTNQDLTLKHMDGDKFFSLNLGMVEFMRDKNKAVCGFKFVDTFRVRNIEFQKR